MTQRANTAERPQPAIPPLLLDLYELTMAQSYYDQGMAAPATFSVFIRHLPPGWAYFVAAGLDDVLTYLETLTFREEDLAYLETTGLFTTSFLAHLRGLRFTGTVRALPEGTVCFPHEPLLEVTAPIIVAQLVETVVLNQLHLQTLIASKAARCVQVAQGRRLVDFGLRRTHGTDAGLKVARSAYLAGFDATSNVLAGQRYGIPIAGTMAHSYVQTFRRAGRLPRLCTALPRQLHLPHRHLRHPGGSPPCGDRGARASRAGPPAARRAHRLG